MSKKAGIHVVKGSNGGWNTKQGGTAKSHHRTQENATKAATVVAKRQKTEVVIHGRDGKIREKNSYGNDPNPPRDH